MLTVKEDIWKMAKLIQKEITQNRECVNDRLTNATVCYFLY